MDWQIYSLQFRQQFADGYRYLDRCGEFIFQASERLNLLPGEAKPTGAALTMPEKGARVNADSNGIVVVQDQPVDEVFFLELSTGVAALARELFGPLRVDMSMFEITFILPLETAGEADAMSLKLIGDDLSALTRAFDMTPKQRITDFQFASGSTTLKLTLTPMAFETLRVNRHNPTIGATPTQAKRANRLSTLADRTPKFAPYGIFLQVNASEMEPPLLSEKKLFALMRQKAEVAKKIYYL